MQGLFRELGLHRDRLMKEIMTETNRFSSCPKSVEELDDLITTPPPALIDFVTRHEGRFAFLGAAGKMGLHFCRQLQRAFDAAGRSDRVLAISRFSQPGSPAAFEQAGCEVIAADLAEPDQVAGLPEADYVYALAGVKFGTADRPDLLQRINVQLPQLVAERYRAARIVSLSTGCVYSLTTPESGGPTEEGETAPVGEYALSCLARERAYLEASQRHGTRGVIIRLNYSIDLRYGVLLDLAQAIWNDVPVSLDMGHVNVIWQGDAVSQILLSMSLAQTPPLILNITGPDTLSVRELAEGLATRLDKTPRFEGVEAPTALLSNAGLSHRLLGEPTVSVPQMLDWTAEWVRRGGQTLNKPTHFAVRDGNY